MKRVVVVGRRPPPVTGENLLTTKLGETLDELGFRAEVRRRFDVRNLFICQATVWLVPGAKPFSFLRDLAFLALWRSTGNRVFCYLHNASRHRFLRFHSWLGFLKCDGVVFVVITPGHEREFAARGYRARVLRNAAADVTPVPATALAKRLFWCGVVSEEKGFRIAAEAFRILWQRDPEWVFDVFGAGPLADARSFPDVRFHGFAAGAEKVKAFAAGGVFILPSAYEHETQSLAVIEALGFGLPVIVSDAGALPEMISGGAGPAGFALPIGSGASAYAEKVREIFDSYPQFSAAAAQHYAAKFSSAAYRETVASIMEASGAG